MTQTTTVKLMRNGVVLLRKVVSADEADRLIGLGPVGLDEDARWVNDCEDVCEITALHGDRNQQCYVYNCNEKSQYKICVGGGNMVSVIHLCEAHKGKLTTMAMNI